MTPSRFALLGFAVCSALAVTFVRPNHADAQFATAQPVGYGVYEAVLYNSADRDVPNGSGSISKVELNRGYPNASGPPIGNPIPGDMWYVLLTNPQGQRVCAMMGNFEEATRLYDLIVTRKARRVRCVVRKTYPSWAGSARINDQDAVRLTAD